MRRLLTLGLAAALVAPPIAPAQQAEKDRNLLFVETFDVDPTNTDRFEASVVKLVAAAKKANLSGSYRWMFTSHGNHYTLVYPIESMGYFDDPEQFMRQFKGPAEADMKAFMAEMQTLPVRTRSVIAEAVPEWQYMPANAPQANFIHVIVERMKPGMDNEYGAVSKEAIALIRSIDYPYEVHGHKMVIGEMVERVWVIPYDTPANFYGPNNFYALLQKRGKLAQWQALEERSRRSMDGMQYHDEEIEHGMSYWVPMTRAAAR